MTPRPAADAEAISRTFMPKAPRCLADQIEVASPIDDGRSLFFDHWSRDAGEGDYVRRCSVAACLVPSRAVVPRVRAWESRCGRDSANAPASHRRLRQKADRHCRSNPVSMVAQNAEAVGSVTAVSNCGRFPPFDEELWRRISDAVVGEDCRYSGRTTTRDDGMPSGGT